MTWSEVWHEGLEEASRMYFGDGNVDGMLYRLQVSIVDDDNFSCNEEKKRGGRCESCKFIKKILLYYLLSPTVKLHR